MNADALWLYRSPASPRRWLGVALLAGPLFGKLVFTAGSLWAGFGVVMRKFRLDPVLATTAAGVFGLAVCVPFYLEPLSFQHWYRASPC